MAVFYIDNVAQDTLAITRGNIYRFDQNNSSNSTAPLNLSATNDGENSGGSPYSEGVSYWLNNVEVNRTTYLSGFSSATSRFIQVNVAATAPATLYYYAVGAPGYGGAISVTG
ncbi:MAG: hypothetical protein ACO3ST_00220 [Burkholderiaceae bacterium]